MRAIPVRQSLTERLTYAAHWLAHVIKQQRSFPEGPAWQHGAFTKALLDAFNDPAADINRNGLISPNGLGNYVTTRVESLTDGNQRPGMEIRYDSTCSQAGMLA